MPLQVVVTDHGFPNLNIERETLEPIQATVTEFQCKHAEEVIAAARHADAIMTQWAPITAEVIAALQQCRVIVRYGIGTDNVDLEAAAKKGIPVVNVPDYALDEVADHTMTLLLASARKLPQVMKQIQTGAWITNPCRPMFSLAGRTLGLAGFGNIARKVAHRAQAFGMQVSAYDPYVESAQFAAADVSQVDWEALLQESDFVSIHLPLTKDTQHLFNEQAFSLMKPGAYLVNTSRGGVVHTEDLIAALQRGRLAGVGLDVLEQEPIAPDSPLLSMPEVLLTSHCAWYTEDALARLKQLAATEIVRVLSGEQPKHIVNKTGLIQHGHMRRRDL